MPTVRTLNEESFIQGQMNKYSPKRRRLYAQGENINRLMVFERDGWICNLCKLPIDSTLRLPDPMAATLDHVIPITLGGEHTYRNIKAAHAQCNFSKGCDPDLSVGH